MKTCNFVLIKRRSICHVIKLLKYPTFCVVDYLYTCISLQYCRPLYEGPDGSMSQVVGLPKTHTSLSPIRRGFAPSFVNYKKGCTRLAAASDKAYQLLVHGRWFSPGTPASSTTKTGRHDIAEILLKVALNTKNQIKSIIYNFTLQSAGTD